MLNDDAQSVYREMLYLLKALEENMLPKIYHYTSYKPRHDKTNKMSVRPAKTHISLGIRPVWSESSLSAWRKLGPLSTL